ncbi:1027_t:CDS:1, partial [Funneliformis mosseae]
LSKISTISQISPVKQPIPVQQPSLILVRPVTTQLITVLIHLIIIVTPIAL